MRKLLVLATSASIAAISFAGYAASQPAPKAAASHQPQIGAFGFDLTGMDRNVAPGDS